MRLVDKPDQLRALMRSLTALLEGERDWIANLANTSALLFGELADINWVGFYLLKDGELVLGPFQGKPACVRIAIGKGVCGTAAQRRESIVVPNVHEFEGHIACDTASNSELVVPLTSGLELLGVLDLDSPRLRTVRRRRSPRHGSDCACCRGLVPARGITRPSAKRRFQRKGVREHSERCAGDLDSLGHLFHHKRQRQLHQGGDGAFLSETPYTPAVRLLGGNEVLNSAELEMTPTEVRMMIRWSGSRRIGSDRRSMPLLAGQRQQPRGNRTRDCADATAEVTCRAPASASRSRQPYIPLRRARCAHRAGSLSRSACRKLRLPLERNSTARVTRVVRNTLACEHFVHGGQVIGVEVPMNEPGNILFEIDYHVRLPGTCVATRSQRCASPFGC